MGDAFGKSVVPGAVNALRGKSKLGVVAHEDPNLLLDHLDG